MGIAAILLASQVKPGGMLDPSKIIGGLQNKPNKQPMQGQQQQQQPFGAPSGYGAPAVGGVQQQHQTYNPSQQQQGGTHGAYTAAGGAAGAAGGYYAASSPPPVQVHVYNNTSPQSYTASHQPQYNQHQGNGMPSPTSSYGGGSYQAQASYSSHGGMPSPNTAPSNNYASFPTPQHYGSPAPPQQPYTSNGYQPSYPAAPPSYSAQGQYDHNRGFGTVAGVAAAGGAAYYGMHKLGGQRLPFGGSHVGIGPNGATDYNYILQVLQFAVQDQRIQSFYPPGSLEPLAHHIATSGALHSISAQYRVTIEIAMDLVRLALFDVVLYIDDSGSMKFEEHGSRIDDLKLVVSRATTAAGLFDTDGISIRFMNSQRCEDRIKTEMQAQQIIAGADFNGMTPLGTNLRRKVIEPFLLQPARSGSLRKPVLIIAITDGEPTGEPRSELANVIKQAKQELGNTRYGADAFSLELAQVGNDQAARRFLEEIDSHPDIGRYVDVTSNYENESDNMLRANPPVHLTPDLYVLKLLLGGIDSTYDHKDERY